MSFLSRSSKKQLSDREQVLAWIPLFESMEDGEQTQIVIDDPSNSKVCWAATVIRHRPGTMMVLPLGATSAENIEIAFEACNNYNALHRPLALHLNSESWDQPVFVLSSVTVDRLDPQLTWLQLRAAIQTLAAEASEVSKALESLIVD